MSSRDHENLANLRCADIDRTMVADVLTNAYADGRITREEHDERLTAVWEAKTFGELTPLTADLIGDVGMVQQYATAGPSSSELVDTSEQNTDVDQITSIMGTHKRDGVWRLRRRTSAFTLMGDIKLDLTQAKFENTECQISATTIMGDVILTVPAGVRIVDRTTTIMGDVKMQGLTDPAPDAPTIVLNGTCIMSDVKVRGPEYRGRFGSRKND